ncbi:MAG: VTT domain-containing protein [Rudaea sp.]
MTKTGEAKTQPQPPAVFAEYVVETAEGSPRDARRRLIVFVAVCLVIVSLILIAVLTPLRHYLDIDHLTRFVENFADAPLAPLAIIVVFIVGGLFVIPVNALTAVTILAFGPIFGGIYSLIGSVLSAVVLYEIARRVPTYALQRRFGVRTQSLHRYLLRHGVIAVALVRLVPVAPYSVVNLILGSLRIDRIDYLIGTALGMTPGIIVNAFFVDRVVAAVRTPSPLTFALVALALALAIGLTIFVRRRLARKAA